MNLDTVPAINESADRVLTSSCPNCGAPVPFESEKCLKCNSFLKTVTDFEKSTDPKESEMAKAYLSGNESLFFSLFSEVENRKFPSAINLSDRGQALSFYCRLAEWVARNSEKIDEAREEMKKSFEERRMTPPITSHPSKILEGRIRGARAFLETQINTNKFANLNALAEYIRTHLTVFPTDRRNELLIAVTAYLSPSEQKYITGHYTSSETTTTDKLIDELYRKENIDSAISLINGGPTELKTEGTTVDTKTEQSVPMTKKKGLLERLRSW